MECGPCSCCGSLFGSADSPRFLRCSTRRRRISYERPMETVLSSGSETVRFGPMAIKSKKKSCLLVTPTEDRFLRDIQGQLEAYQFDVKRVKSCEEISEFLENRIPNLVVLDARTKPKNWDPFSMIRAFQAVHKSFASPVLVAVTENSFSQSQERHTRSLRNAGTAQVVSGTSVFGDFLHLFDQTIWPLQVKVKASAGLFGALDQSETAIEITDDSRNVQYVNSAYELLTGCLHTDVLGTLSSDLRRKSLPRKFTTKERKPHLMDGQEKRDSLVGSNEWRCFPVPGTSFNNPHEQLVYYKTLPHHYNKQPEIRRPFSIDSKHHRRSVNGPVSLETPISEILGLLRDAQQKSVDVQDEKLEESIQEALKILSSVEFYAPIKATFNEEDKVSADLFDGLIMNGPQRVQPRSRKMSLTDTMRETYGLKPGFSGLLRSMSPDIRGVLDNEDLWSFSIFELERITFRRPLVHLGMKIFEKWKLRDYLQCSESCLRGWLQTIESYYRAENPYHSAVHAADVLQSTAYFLGQEAISNAVEHSDAVAGLLAAVIHDVDHPGKGSAFLINARHTLAMLYNDVSVLENHHAALAFQVTFSDARINIFARMSRQEYGALRKSIVDMVLATDMNRHFDYLAKFQQTVLAKQNNGIRENQTISAILIKCADINNPTRPWELCKQWAYRIVEEYFAQTAEERAKGLPLTMEVFDRDSCNVPLTQSRFIDMFARDLFQGWCEFGEMPELLSNLEWNYRKWQEEAAIWPQQRHQEMSRIGRLSMESLSGTTLIESSIEPIPETPLLCGDS